MKSIEFGRWSFICVLALQAEYVRQTASTSSIEPSTFLPTNYPIASGLADYGHEDLAADIADKTIANAIKNGISEHYDSISGRPLGVRDYCMCSTLVAMMLDGLTRKYQLKLR